MKMYFSEVLIYVGRIYLANLPFYAIPFNNTSYPNVHSAKYHGTVASIPPIYMFVYVPITNSWNKLRYLNIYI